MPVQYCTSCNKYIDLDEEVEHFDENGECVYKEENEEDYFNKH